MAKFLHDEWLYDLQNYHYSRALRSIKQQEEVPNLLVKFTAVNGGASRA